MKPIKNAIKKNDSEQWMQYRDSFARNNWPLHTIMSNAIVYDNIGSPNGETRFRVDVILECVVDAT